MRQYHYNFVIDNQRLGIGRAECSPDANRIEESDYHEHGYTLGLKNSSSEEEK